MDWEKHAKVTTSEGTGAKQRRVAVPVTPQLEVAIDRFKQRYAPKKFADAAVMKTMIEAGFKVWFTQIQNEDAQNATTQPEHQAQPTA